MESKPDVGSKFDVGIAEVFGPGGSLWSTCSISTVERSLHVNGELGKDRFPAKVPHPCSRLTVLVRDCRSQEYYRQVHVLLYELKLLLKFKYIGFSSFDTCLVGKNYYSKSLSRKCLELRFDFLAPRLPILVILCEDSP